MVARAVMFELFWAVYMVGAMMLAVEGSYRVVYHFRQEAELSMTRIFLDDRMPDAFKLFAASLMLYGSMVFIGVAAIQLGYDSVIYHYLSKLGAAVAAGSWAVMAQRLAASSTPRPDA